MSSFFKFIFIFLIYGVVWFFIFSIPTSDTNTIYLSMQKALNLNKDPEKTEKQKNAIQKDQVIDALSKAFAP